MKSKILLTLVFTCMLLSASAQSIEFKYDDAGNRTDRVMKTIELISRSNAVDSTTQTSTFEEETLLNCTIRIYPNPTYGQLRVEIEGLSEEIPIDWVLSDRNGILLQKRSGAPSSFNLDFSSYPPSWYILAFVSGEHRREFKIIKM